MASTNQTPPKHFRHKISKLSTLKIRKYLSNVHKIGGAYLQCVNNQYATLEYRGMYVSCFALKITQTRHYLSILDEQILPYLMCAGAH